MSPSAARADLLTQPEVVKRLLQFIGAFLAEILQQPLQRCTTDLPDLGVSQSTGRGQSALSQAKPVKRCLISKAHEPVEGKNRQGHHI